MRISAETEWKIAENRALIDVISGLMVDVLRISAETDGKSQKIGH